MKEYGIQLIAIFITLAALGFSIFGAIYSNLTHNIRMADANAHLGSVEANRHWRTVSSNFREQAKRRAYSTNLSFWSLVAIIITLITYFFPCLKWVCLITFLIAVVLLGAAGVIALGRCKWLVKRPVKPEVEEWPLDS